MAIAGVSDTTHDGVATNRDKARSSAAATAFADVLAKAGKAEESPPVLTLEQEAEAKENQRIKDLLKNILTGPDSANAGKSVAELGENLDQDFAELGQDINELAEKYGLDHVTVLEFGILIRIPSPIDTSKYFVQGGVNGERLFNGSGVTAEIDRLKEQGVWDSMLESCYKQVEDFLEEYRESRRDWNEMRDALAARSAIMDAAATRDGFADEYAADPEATIDKYFDQLRGQFKSVSVTYRDGEISWYPYDATFVDTTPTNVV